MSERKDSGSLVDQKRMFAVKNAESLSSASWERTHVLALDEFVEKTCGDGPLVGVQPVENRLLRFEVVVEPALGQPQVVQDVLDGRLLVALFDEEPAGGIEDSSFGVSGMHIVRHADGLPFVHVPVKHTDRRSVCQMIEEAAPAMRLNIRGKAGRRRPVRRRVQVQYLRYSGGSYAVSPILL